MSHHPAVGIRDVEDAAERLRGVAVRTPLIENAELNDRAGCRVLLKPECLQRTGSFKIRGAYNLMSQLSSDEKQRGVVTWSSGNHAQGVAAAGRIASQTIFKRKTGSQDRAAIGSR